jgi:hypothetical protein
MAIGQIFTVAFFPDRPHLIAAGGSKGLLALWDTAEDAGDVTDALITSGGGAASAADAGSLVAQHFSARIADPKTVPSHGIRHRSDGQSVE